MNILLFGKQTYAQITEAKLGKNQLTASITYPFFRTFSFGYERMISKKGIIRLNGSIQSLSNKDSYKSTQILLFGVTLNKHKVFTSNSISVGYGFLIIPKAGFYVASDLTYRYNYFENKYFYQCVGMDMDSKVSLLSEYHHEYGLQNMAGIKLTIVKYRGIRLIADFNAGVGFYYSNQKHLLIADIQGNCSAVEVRYYDEPIETHIVEMTTLVILRAGLGINF